MISHEFTHEDLGKLRNSTKNLGLTGIHRYSSGISPSKLDFTSPSDWFHQELIWPKQGKATPTSCPKMGCVDKHRDRLMTHGRILLDIDDCSYQIISNHIKSTKEWGDPWISRIWVTWTPPKSVISCGPSVLVCGGSAESQRTQWDGMVGSTQGASANHRNWLSIVQYYAILYYYNWYDITDILVITCYNYRKNTIRDTRVAIVTISQVNSSTMRWVGSNRQLNPLIGFLWAHPIVGYLNVSKSSKSLKHH